MVRGSRGISLLLSRLSLRRDRIVQARGGHRGRELLVNRQIPLDRECARVRRRRVGRRVFDSWGVFEFVHFFSSCSLSLRLDTTISPREGREGPPTGRNNHYSISIFLDIIILSLYTYSSIQSLSFLRHFPNSPIAYHPKILATFDRFCILTFSLREQ